MRRFSFLVVTLLLLGCSSDDLDSSNVVGKWKLVQTLVDPGDGSGRFSDVESNKTLAFLNNGTFISENGVVCFMSDEEKTSSTGTFSSEEKKIYPNSCDSFARIALEYTFDNGFLVINYPCIERCAEKYRKKRKTILDVSFPTLRDNFLCRL